MRYTKCLSIIIASCSSTNDEGSNVSEYLQYLVIRLLVHKVCHSLQNHIRQSPSILPDLIMLHALHLDELPRLLTARLLAKALLSQHPPHSLWLLHRNQLIILRMHQNSQTSILPSILVLSIHRTRLPPDLPLAAHRVHHQITIRRLRGIVVNQSRNVVDTRHANNTNRRLDVQFQRSGGIVLRAPEAFHGDLQSQRGAAGVADQDVAVAKAVIFLQVDHCGKYIVDVVWVASVAGWIVWVAGIGWVSWVGREAVVDGGDAGDLIPYRRSGIGEDVLLGSCK
jgi:hypothetical protein